MTRKEDPFKNMTRGEINVTLITLSNQIGMSVEDSAKALRRGDFKVVQAEKILKELSVVTVSPHDIIFKAKNFRLEDKGGFYFTLDEYFRKMFLSPGKKFEGPTFEDSFKEHFIRSFELIIPSNNKAIKEACVRQVSGNITINLRVLFNLMFCQGDGEDGPLLNNGSSNIFFVRDIGMTLRVVSVCWYKEMHRWDVHVSSVNNTYNWCVGHRVFVPQAA